MFGAIGKVSIVLVFALALVSCAQNEPRKSAQGAGARPAGGGYYLDDRPPPAEEYKHNINEIADAVPRVEPLSRTGNKPYTALGQKFFPLSTARGYAASGKASWYGMRYHGNRTSSGEPYDVWKMTAAHPTLPLPSYVEVTNLDNGKRVVVRVNDRGPFLRDRIIDLSYVAARKLDIIEKGTGRVHVRALLPSDYVKQIASGQTVQGSQANAATAQNTLKFFLQFGAFSVADNAIRLRQRLASLQYNVYPKSQKEFINLGAPYRVLVGPFADSRLAYESREKLQRLFEQDINLVSDY